MRRTFGKNYSRLAWDGRKWRNETTAQVRKARADRLSLAVSALAALTIVCGYSGNAQAAAKLKVLYSFKNLRGILPYAGLIADGAGNLYGTTSEGGAHNDGVVFELSPPVAGKSAWTEKVLLSFDGSNGSTPPGGSLIEDGAGNLYGTTNGGGAYGGGEVFELTPPAAGKTAWIESVLFSFDLSDGYGPAAGLLADSKGDLFGTTVEGGPGGLGAGGVAFELSPPPPGTTAWTETVLVDFTGPNGTLPQASLIADGAGNLYGTTQAGGAHNDGVVFELSPPLAGKTAWTETVLFSFDGTNGYIPQGALLADGAGNLYGTTSSGGANNDGEAYELSPPGAGKKAWTEKVLISFDGLNGDEPQANLIADSAGDLFGTTAGGGTDGNGVIFELSPPVTGKKAWTEKVLVSFDGTNGTDSYSGLIADGAGNLYGTTQAGGTGDGGVAFMLTP